MTLTGADETPALAANIPLAPALLALLQGGPLSGVRINKSIGSRGQSFDWGKRREGAHDGDDAGWQGCAGGLPVGRSACHLAQSSEMAVLLMWERIGVAWTLCWGAPRASTRSLASVFRQARRGSARRVSDGAPSCGALCSSGVSLLTELTPVLLRIVRRAQVSEACERGDRVEGVGMRDRRCGESSHDAHTPV